MNQEKAEIWLCRESKTTSHCQFAILDDVLASYYPVVCEGRRGEYPLHGRMKCFALWLGHMDYKNFLIKRRKLIATIIENAYERLRDHI